MIYEDLLLVKKNGIAILTLNQPKKMNALSQGMREGIPGAIADVAGDDSIKALVITGAGRAFCSGADVGDLKSGVLSDRWIDVKFAKGTGFHIGPLLWNFDKPTIAAINGIAIGAGFGLAMNCDMRIASDQARLGAGYVRMALATEWGISYILPKIVGVSRAAEILLTGDLIEATEAERIGLVNKVVPAENLMDAVNKFAAKLVTGPSFAYRQIKNAIRNGLNTDYRTQIEYEAYVQSMCLDTYDHKEATTSFFEKRKPKFK